MTSKERVYAALEGRIPDRVPYGEFAVDFDTVERVLGRIREGARAATARRAVLGDPRRRDVGRRPRLQDGAAHRAGHVPRFLPRTEQGAGRNVKGKFGKKILKHCCGNINLLLDFFIDIGFDAYQSIQPTAGMDICRLKKDYGDRIALWGGVAVGTKYDNYMAMLDEVAKLCQY